MLATDNDVLIIDCLKRTMPQLVSPESLQGYDVCDESTLSDISIQTIEELCPEQRKVMHERYTLIAPILPFIHNEAERSDMIDRVAELNRISKQTVRKYLRLYLAYQRMEVLAPSPQQKQRELTPDEKNFRWALNKFYYTQKKHSMTFWQGFQQRVEAKIYATYCDDCLPRQGFVAVNTSSHQFLDYLKAKKCGAAAG